MNNYPIKKINKEAKDTDNQKKVQNVRESSYSASSFISCRYSYKSVSSFGGKTHIKAKQERFENGKFESEEFEGTTDGNMYDNAVIELQQTLCNHFASLLNPFSFLPPFSEKKDKEK